MKKDYSKQNAVIVILVSVFALAMVISIFPVNHFSFTTSANNAQNSNISPQLNNATIKTGSIVNGSKVFIVGPNSTSVQNALDSVCKDNNGICSLSSPKFLIKSSTVLFDSNQVQYPTSTLVNIPLQSFLPWVPKISITDSNGNLISQMPKLSLTDSQGHLLDLGTVQLGLYGVTNVDTDVIVTGVFSVYLDDKTIYSKQFATQGKTLNGLIPITSFGNNGVFTFTFADEGKDWKDGETHIFKIMLGNVVATVGSGDKTSIFQYSNAAPVYVLVMTVNQNKITTIGVDNKAIAIFKSDDSIQACGRNGIVSFQTLGDVYNHYYSGYVSQQVRNTGLISIYENGFLITKVQSANTIPSYNSANPDSVDANSGMGQKSCVTQTGIPRDADLLVTIGTNQYNIHTPTTQTTLIYDCSGDAVPNDPFTGSIRNSCPSNFIVK